MTQENKDKVTKFIFNFLYYLKKTINIIAISIGYCFIMYWYLIITGLYTF